MEAKVPDVDPANPFRGPRWLGRIISAIAQTPPMRWFGINVMTRVDPYLLRWTTGRVSLFAVYPHVQLTVPGRKSGELRTVPLLYFTHRGEVVVMASSFGRDDYPAWYRNVVAHPEVTLVAHGESHPYVARETEGAERDELFALAVRFYPGFADYQRRIDAAGRHLPIMALRPLQA